MSSLRKNTAGMPSIFIADASALDCELLTSSVVRNHLRVLGWGTNSKEVIDAIATQKPNIAVISTRLADGVLAGFDTTRELRRLQPATRIIMLFDTTKPDMVVEAFRSGAMGVFSRNQLSSDLRKCIRCILAGQLWANNQEVLYLIDALRSAPSPFLHVTNYDGVALLTNRQAQVVNLVVGGRTNKEIAKQLGLSQHTVKNYMFAIFDKLGISTRVELVLYAMNNHGSRRVETRNDARDSSSCLTDLLVEVSGMNAGRGGYGLPDEATPAPLLTREMRGLL
jgi:two-component system nitrate/nitrite response regulator NarL